MSQTLSDIIYERNSKFQIGCRISTALEYLNYIQLPFGAEISNRPEKGCLGVDYILIKYYKLDKKFYINLKIWKYDHFTNVKENVLKIGYYDKNLNKLKNEEYIFDNFNHINRILNSILCE